MIYITNQIECGIVSVGHLLGPNGYLSYEDFKAKYPDAIANFMLYECIVRSVRHHQDKLGLEFEETEEDCIINEAHVQKCISGGIYKHIYKHIYMHFVKNDDISLECIENGHKKHLTFTVTPAQYSDI